MNWKQGTIRLPDPDAAYARKTDPETSEDAAESVRGDRVTKLQLEVLQALETLGGKGTAWDVSQTCGIDLQSITPRFRPLADQGWIRETGERRPGRTGRPCVVWEISRREAT